MPCKVKSQGRVVMSCKVELQVKLQDELQVKLQDELQV
jgi:hypothetical protein